MSDLDLRQLARETAKKIKGWIRGECDTAPTYQELNLVVLSALERAVSSRDEEWTQTLLPEIPGLRKATPAGVRRGVEERMAAALSAERARVLEKACAAVCEMCAGRWSMFGPAIPPPPEIGNWWHPHKSSGDPLESGIRCRADAIRRAFAGEPLNERE